MGDDPFEWWNKSENDEYTYNWGTPEHVPPRQKKTTQIDEGLRGHDAILAGAVRSLEYMRGHYRELVDPCRSYAEYLGTIEQLTSVGMMQLIAIALGSSGEFAEMVGRRLPEQTVMRLLKGIQAFNAEHNIHNPTASVRYSAECYNCNEPITVDRPDKKELCVSCKDFKSHADITPGDKPDPRGFYVYLWCTLNLGRPLYIGKGIGNRAWNPHRTALTFDEKTMRCDILVEGLTNREAHAAECLAIRLYRGLGHNLHNIQDGWVPQDEGI